MNKFDKHISKVVNKKARFCTPGHKGRGEAIELWSDITEVEGTDNLYNPTGIIKEAQETVAQAYGAKQSFFLVNGSTSGIFAMLAAVCKRGDKVIVARGCHISVINAGALLGLNFVYVEPSYIREFEIYGGVDKESLEQFVTQNSDAKAVLITSPTYYGVCSDIAAIAELVHKHSMRLLVDGAHGAHLPFSGLLPKGAMEQGADACVNSAHKTIPALTQASLLHIGDNIDAEAVRRALSMVQTSSPSYILMQSLYCAVEFMKKQGERELARVKELCDKLRHNLDQTSKMNCLAGEGIDATRLVLNFSRISTSAEQIKARMNNVLPEIAAGNNLVCVPTVNNTAKDFKMLEGVVLRALKDFETDVKPIFKPAPAPLQINIPLEQAYFAECEMVSSAEAVGRVAGRTAEYAAPAMVMFPPGCRIDYSIGEKVCVVIER